MSANLIYFLLLLLFWRYSIFFPQVMLTTCYPWLHMLFTKKKINKKKEERNVYVKNTEIRLMILEWLSFRNEFHSSSEWISYSKRVRATSASAILAKTVLKVGWYLKLLTSSPRSQYPVSRVASIFPKKEILPSLPLPDLPRKIEGDSIRRVRSQRF